ncbi:MAG: ABC transporter ATP-binding protein [Actinomycetota bacterium]
MPETVIKTEGLTKYYGKVVGVQDLDLEVFQGELFGFLGPNGAGKTTTIRLIMGMLKPNRGSASVKGLDAWQKSVDVKRLVGYLPGEPALYPRMTGEELVRFVDSFDGGHEASGRALSTRLELDLDRKVEGYSRGMKQKLAIVLALMKDPPLLIMDEPTNGLDPLTQHVLYEILNERREGGTTVLFSSHNLPEVERLADRVGIIREGSLVGTERIEDLRGKHLRNVEVIYTADPPDGLERVEGVSDFERAGNRIQLKFRGDLNALLRVLTSHDLMDLSIGHASLEDAFLEFYGPDGGEPE